MKLFVFILSLVISFNSFGQGFNDDKVALSNFLKRMYNNKPFEGVKLVEDYEKKYLISVLSLEKAKYNNSSTINRVAQVKAQSQANTFLNGSTITYDLLIKTTEQKTNDSTNTLLETIESIKENSSGFTKGMEILVNFDDVDEKRMVYIFYREIIMEFK